MRINTEEAARKLALRGSIHHSDVRDESNSMDMTDQVETELESITGVPPTDDSAESETSSSISQPTQVGIKRVMAHGWANLPTFQEFDEDETGSLDRFQFNKALKKMFSMNSAFLTRAELKHIANLFDVNNDGMVDYMKFLDFAHKQSKPCQRHRRLVCGECIKMGACYRLGCDCHSFVRRSPRDHMICTCSHGLKAHQLEPADNADDAINSEALTEQQMRVIFHDRVADLGMPTTVAGEYLL